MMARGHSFAVFLVISLLANAFCLPSNGAFRKRSISDNKAKSTDSSVPDDTAKDTQNKDSSADDDTKIKPADEDDDDDDDDFDDFQPSPPSNGGSNIISLLNLANGLLPSLSGHNNVKKNNEVVKTVIREAITRYRAGQIQKRRDIGDNEIDIDYATDLKPPVFERQESDENGNGSESSKSNSEESDEDNGAEESVEQPSKENGGSKSKQDSASNASNADDDNDENDSDYDEPEGDGQGGGILGLLAGLSGDGESDLGSLLATIGGIVANLSGDGVDLNAIIATGIGLFVGLLSDENTNPGQVIASYLLTSLDTITGGGAQNNGAFFGKFLSSLVKGVSAAAGDEDSNGDSDENGGGGMKMADSAGFFFSLLMGLLGEMSKTSSGSSSWR